MSVFGKVENFNMEIIGIDRTTAIGPIVDQEELGFFIGTLQEEIDEFIQANEEKDFIGQIDALVDLIYFAAGGFTRMGVPSHVTEKIFTAVHDANMTKKKGKKDRENGCHELDAVKPLDWVSPEERIMIILDRYTQSHAEEDGTEVVPGQVLQPCGGAA
jgi:predicted HAD superfamily Cof-like phosphohydrolase